MSNVKKLMMAAASGAADLPEAVDFDGTNDYLNRSTDLVGNADGKIFTFSAFVYGVDGNDKIYHIDSGGGGTIFQIAYDGSGSGSVLRIIGATPSRTTVLYAPNAGTLSLNTWNHILISIDLSNTSRRHVYINDVQQSVTYSDYSNQNMDLTMADYLTVGGAKYSGGPYSTLKGRLAHVYLDYTYRDLTTTSNRRLFVTEDLKPADGQASLSPIIYLPMTDASTAGDNLGTGGDFTVNGTVATSDRAPNQNNCVASKFDGSNDYLSKSISQVDGSVLTCSFIFKQNATSAVSFNAYDGGSSSPSTQIQNANYANAFRVILRNTSGSQICSLESSFRVPQYSEASVQVSLDISNASDRKVKMFLNGVEDTSVSKTFYTSDTTFRLASNSYINGGNGADYYNGTMGEFYLDTAYIDLSSDNPFWDSDNGRPKPVRQVIEETGNTPKIALPMNASNPGLNLGTEGNYTQNGGNFAGARGGSEYIQRSCYPATSLGYLTNNSVFSGVSNSKEMTLFFALNRRDNGNGRYFFRFDKSTSSLSTYMQLRGDQGNGAYWYFNSQNGGNILNTTSSSAVFSYQDWNVFALSVDLTNTSNRHFYKNRSSEGMNWSDYVNTDIPWSQFNRVSIFSQSSTSSSQYWNQFTGPFYLATEYIDLSNESNLNFFVDQLGQPRNLSSAISDGNIPNPVIYLPFDDTTDFGKNLGTGGDFTVNNTLVRGGDVDRT